MVEPGSEVTEFPALVVTIFVGATILVIVYISSLFKTRKEDVKKRHVETVAKDRSHVQQHHTQSSHHQTSQNLNNPDGLSSTTGAGNKKKNAQKWRPDSSKQNYTNPWLVTSFKGHGGSVPDMDFSPNGKFLASCGEDDGSSGTSSGSEANKENNPVAPSTGLSRRQKKNHRIRRDENAGVLGGNTVKKKSSNQHHRNGNNRTKHLNGILKQHYLHGVPDLLLMQYLQHYLIRIDQLFWLGFPVEVSDLPGRAFVFKQSGDVSSTSRNGGNIIITSTPTSTVVTTSNSTPLSSTKGFDINAREFIPKDNLKYSNVWSINNNNINNNNNNNNNSNNNNNLYNSKFSNNNNNINLYDNVNSMSATSKVDCRTSASKLDVHCDLQNKLSTADNYGSKINEENNVEQFEKKCMRCGRMFLLSSKGTYLTREQCLYHWGRFKKHFECPEISIYSCCNGKRESRGCTTGKMHVWSGLQENVINGPLDGFVRTRPRKTPPPDGSNGLYAIDCEMCFTNQGLELVKVTVIGADGRIVYDTLVKPENEIVDYNTRFSGISAKDMNKKCNYKVLKEVQNDLMGFINADTILLGHGVENDLRALKMIHTTIVDTAVVFPHYYGLPYRRSLKSLVECFLNRSIQSVNTGHDSIEDAMSCLELMLWKVKKDLGYVHGDHSIPR